MKIRYRRVLATAASFLTGTALLAQTTSQERISTTEAKTDSSTLRVITRDANSSTVEWTELLTNAVTGEVTQQNHRYVTVGTGLNYQDESGQWRPSEDLIELQPDGSAAALRGPHKIHFSPNLNTAGAISLTTASNRVFRSHPLALYYLNAQTGERALVARVKDSIGELHPPNQLVYPDCLEGAKADYRVTYTNDVMVAKHWITEQQRQLLIESADWSDIAPKLESLPQAGRVASASNLNDRVAKGRQLPTIKVAASLYRAKGFVLDYVAVGGSGDYTFASGVTYLIGSGGYWGGTVTFQPNCIIKFDIGAYLIAYTSIVCNGA